MNSSSEHLTRGRVLSGVAVSAATPADLGAVRARPARALVVSPELVEMARQEGYAAGYDEGQQVGYQDGIAGAQRHTELLAGLVQRLNEAADNLMAREATAREDIENQVVEVAFVIAQALLGHELEQPDTRGRAAIARALAIAPEQGLVVARLNPADIAAIDPTQLALGRAIELVADPSVSPGDCIVDVGACRVDANIAAAIARVQDVLS
jgi:flagellar assembly protein FliH